MLPLMRVRGAAWDGNFDKYTLSRINKIIDGEYDQDISDKSREEVIKRGLNSVSDYSGLPTYLAAYIIYGRHSERANEAKYGAFR